MLGLNFPRFVFLLFMQLFMQNVLGQATARKSFASRSSSLAAVFASFLANRFCAPSLAKVFAILLKT